ncbi:MAG: cytochrome C oxidase subunit IV family protein [Spirochaetaceae bacterium]|nr:cytochrome C oxidase subunit IV family protein [Spirochaetaceae bacterium]
MADQHVEKHVRQYLIVFAALLVLTIITVLASRIDIGVGAGIVLALIIASVKGTLVAGVFMHLFSDKRKIVYTVLIYTGIFLLVLFLLTALSYGDTLDLGDPDSR